MPKIRDGGVSYTALDSRYLLTFQQSITNVANVVNLVGDVAAPGATHYYGTNALGVKGFWPVAILAEVDPFFTAWLAGPPNVSIFTNDAGYITAWGPETDPAWAAWLAGPPNVSVFTNDAGYIACGGVPACETDPAWAAWLAGPPNVSIFTNDAGYIACGGVPACETDPAWAAWLAGPPNISIFTNDVPYLTADPYWQRAGTVISPLVAGDDITTTGTLTASTLVMAGGSITDTTGAISFNNENLTTTGTLGAGVSTFAGNNGNAAFTLLNLNNNFTPLTGQTAQTSDLVFNLTQSINSVVSLHEAAKISAYKVSDWFHASTEADTDSGLKFWTTNSGTPTLQLTIDEAGLATFAGNITTTGTGTFGTATIFGDPSLNNLIVGYGASAAGYSSIALGTNATASDDQSFALGYNAFAGYSSIALGPSSSANGDYSIALGYAAYAPNDNEISFSNQDSTYGTSNGIGGYTQLDIYNGVANFQKNSITTTGTIYNKADNSKHYFGAGDDASIYYDGTDLAIDTSLVAASDLNLTCGANKTLELQNVVWNDINFSLVTAKVPAAHYPTWTTFLANLNSYTFAIDDYADIATAEILHDWKEGTDLGIHLHIVTNGLNNATARKAKYIVYYSWGDMNEVMSAQASLTAELTIAANLADKTYLFLDMGDITGTNYKIGSLLKMRVMRIAGTGTEPANDPFVEQVGIHYQIDTIGSRQELIK